MPDYTIVNLREVEDSATKFGYAPDLSARFATGDLGLERSGISLQRLAAGTRAPFGHREPEQEELYVVVSGGGRMKLNDEIDDLRQWDAIRVPAGVARQAEAGPEGIELIAFGAPRTGEQGNKAEMLPDWWKD
jgi:mannose-6-phosphate isomerase-like protein (cupin superfamily)